MRLVSWRTTVIGAALASLLLVCANAESTRTLSGSVEGVQDGEPVWIGVFGDEAAEGSWTQATGVNFQVALPAGERATVLVVSKNRVPLTVPVTSGSPAKVALRLALGLALSGAVRSEDGARLTDAEITIEPAESDGLAVPPTATPRWRSDRRGGFRVGGLRPGRHAVTLKAEGHVPLTLEDVQVRKGVDNRIEAELPTAHFIAGRLVDGRGGPVIGVDVHMLPVYGRTEVSARTNRDGAYRLGPFLRGERATVFAQSPELGSTVHHEDVVAPRDNLVLVLRRHALLGRLVDETTGGPVREFRITVLCQGDDFADDGDDNVYEVEADDGRFRLPLDVGAYSVIVQAPGYAPWFQWVAPPDGEEYDLGEIALVPGRSLSGRVVDASTGRPIPGARIRRLFPKRAHAVWSMWDANHATAPKPAVTGEDGTFTLHDLPVEVRVRAGAKGYAFRQVRLPPGATHVDLELDAAAPGADSLAPVPVVVIAGSIVRADGTPVAGRVNLYRAADAASADVGLHGDSIDENHALANGAFRFERKGLPDGAYGLVAGTDVGVVARRTVVITDGRSVEGVRLVVKEGKWLQISIVGLAASESARVAIHEPERRTVFESWLSNGVHRVSGVPDEAVVTAEEGRSMHSRWLTRRIQLGDSGEAAVRFDFTTRSRLTGTVTAGGRPLGGMVLRVLPANSSAPKGYTHTNHQGRYDVYGLAEGPHTVQMGPHSFAVHVAQEAQDTPFDIELPAVSLAGVVRYAPTGRPVWGAEVQLRQGEGYSDWAVTMPDGTFHFDGLAAGEHVVRVSKPGLESLSQNLWIAGDEVVELHLAEAAGGNDSEDQERSGAQE